MIYASVCSGIEAEFKQGVVGGLDSGVETTAKGERK